ncbi:unnamed protein product [Rotaria sp. Silwood1]|nr:unnamed protein product [Rotaria sp. Silwood1]CAF3670966.1 unnamed protein product [Rotaria sp. Silwood1]CAF4769246.1 unnamed protein product [Rotaria sp. Silwood1]
MFRSILLFFIYLPKLCTTISYDGIIHRSSDGSSYAYLSPPRTGNHASFIEQMTPTGTLAVAWFTGGENLPNCSIAVSILEIKSQQFTPGIIVSERINYSNQNPVLFWDNETQILHLYHSSQLSYSFILRSNFVTSSWTRTDIPMTTNLVQPSIVRLTNSSKLRTFFRDRNAVSIYYADSYDDGLTWTVLKSTSLPNNNAGIEAYTLKTGALVIAFNNHNGTQQPRSPLTVALSYDNGITWPYQRNIQIHDDDNITKIGEYSYPSLLQSFWSESDDNDIHLVYTYNRETIKYVRFNEKWIKFINTEIEFLL